MTEVLSVNQLAVSFTSDTVSTQVLSNVSLSLEKGKTLGIVGESGCGKSVTALSIMRLLPQPAGRITNGSISFDGKNLVSLPAVDMRSIRGNRIAMIFQDPMSALNPVHRIGKQLMEVYQLHFPEFSTTERHDKALNIMEQVGISDPVERFKEYPHQLSGGMRQRIMIAMALACEPDVLIADEPTTALDVTIQAQILRLMSDLQKEKGMAIIFITHDLGVIAQLCDDVAVMYAGRVVERATVFDIFKFPSHPYTKGLLASIPRLDGVPKTMLSTIEGQVPSLHNMPSGCRFNNRCPHSNEQCLQIIPELVNCGDRHEVSCFHWQRLAK